MNIPSKRDITGEEWGAEKDNDEFEKLGLEIQYE